MGASVHTGYLLQEDAVIPSDGASDICGVKIYYNCQKV